MWIMHWEAGHTSDANFSNTQMGHRCQYEGHGDLVAHIGILVAHSLLN